MSFKQIEPEHPYLLDCQREGLPWAGSELERIYHPADAEWPLYSIHVYQTPDGVFAAVSRKQELSGWWVTWSHFNPLPSKLVPVLAELLLASSSR